MLRYLSCLMKIWLLAFLLLCPATVVAATQVSPKAYVKKIIAYSEQNGDVLVQLTRNGSQCSSGYWLRRTDPGFQANYEILLWAFQSGFNSVVIEGSSLRIWPEASLGVYCHAYSVRLSR